MFKKRIEEKKKHLIPFLKSSISNDINFVILLIPIWWLLGLKFIVFHLLSLWIFLKLVATKGKKIIYVPKEAIILLFFIGSYMTSIVFNLPEASTTRILASLYNFSFWIMGFLLLITIYNTINKKFLFLLFKTLSIIGLIGGIISIFSIIIWFKGFHNLEMRSILARLINPGFITSEAKLIYSSLNPCIASTDWIFGKPVPRAFGFEVYPTAMGALMFLTIMMTLAYYKITQKKVLKIVLIFEYLALFASLSRIAILITLFSGLLVSFFLRARRYSYLLIFQILILIIILTSFFIHPSKILSLVIDFREGSSKFRAELYKVTLTEAMKKPIFGYGAKPRTEDFYVPLGSHSMYLGVIFKTGVLGLFIFLLFWIRIVYKWWSQRMLMEEKTHLKYVWFYGGVSILGGLAWTFSEDLDAPSIVAFIYLLIVSIVISLNKLKIKEGEK